MSKHFGEILKNLNDFIFLYHNFLFFKTSYHTQSPRRSGGGFVLGRGKEKTFRTFSTFETFLPLITFNSPYGSWMAAERPS